MALDKLGASAEIAADESDWLVQAKAASLNNH
jgi:hypothetical protein